MGEIETSKKQINFYYNPNSSIAKQALAYAKTEGIPILEIDLLQTKLPGTQIIELANRLNIQVRDLVNQEHPNYKSHFQNHNFNEEDWIKMIRQHPEIMQQPIAIHGDVTILIKTPTDILKI